MSPSVTDLSSPFRNARVAAQVSFFVRMGFGLMSIADLELHVLQHWADQRIPAHARTQVWIELA